MDGGTSGAVWFLASRAGAGPGGVGVDAVVLSAVGVLLDCRELFFQVCYRVVALRFVVGSWAVCSMTRRRPEPARAIFSDLVEAPMSGIDSVIIAFAAKAP